MQKENVSTGEFLNPKMLCNSIFLFFIKILFQAHQYILNAEPYKPKNLFIEKAKYFWKQGDQANALKILERGTVEMELLGPLVDRKLHGKSKLLKARYNAEAVNVNYDTNIRFFKEAIIANKQCEKAFVLLSEYKEKRLKDVILKKDGLKSFEIMETYAMCMQYGCNYLYQSMPRFLTIWLDYTCQVTMDKTERQNRTETDKMNRLVELLLAKIPLYFFYTAFSQLASRICHPNSDVLVMLQTILVKLINTHPQQSLWMLVSIFKSAHASRVKRCNELFADKRLSDPAVQKLIQDFNSLAGKLLELSDKDVTGNVGLKVNI